MRTAQFEIEHIDQFKNFAGQENIVVGAKTEDFIHLKDGGASYTIFNDDDIPIGCGGLIECHKYRALAWCLFQRTNDPVSFVYIHKIVSRVIRDSNYPRIEAYVNPMLLSSVRWIKQLGFKLEVSYYPYFFADGTGASLYAIMR